jgi:hypothetical protein
VIYIAGAVLFRKNRLSFSFEGIRKAAIANSMYASKMMSW